MNQPHPDWNEDRKLWELLGKVPSQRPPSNFAYSVHQKLQEKTSFTSQKRTWSLLSLFRNWSTGLVTVAACFAILFAFIQFPVPQNTVSPEGTQARIESSFEIVQFAQNFELIQDMEVIENLDSL